MLSVATKCIMLNVIRLSLFYAECHIKSIMSDVIILNVIMLNFIMFNVIMLNVITLNVIVLNVIC
jgi:hypothetical protein